MTDDVTSREALTRVLTGLDEYTVLDATQTDDELRVVVIATAISAPCPGCGEMTAVACIPGEFVLPVAGCVAVAAGTGAIRSVRRSRMSS